MKPMISHDAGDGIRTYVLSESEPKHLTQSGDVVILSRRELTARVKKLEQYFARFSEDHPKMKTWQANYLAWKELLDG